MAPSALALQVLLEEASPRLLDAVLDTDETALLRGLAERWYQDRRPEVRQSLHAYVDDGLLRPNHQPLAKRLFKLAEAAQDHETMAHMLVACDRMAQRRLVSRGWYDYQNRTYRERQEIRAHANIPRRSPTRNLKPVNGRCPAPEPKRFVDPWTGKRRTVETSHLATFTFRTRRYLARRAWRYFRSLSKADPVAYRDAITLALTLYEDQNLSESLQLLDAWGLVHALYHNSPLLVQARTGWEVNPGCALSDIGYAPYAAQVWTEDPQPLFGLVARGRSKVVRCFALDQLRQHHASALSAVPLDQVRRFLISPHQEVMQFGAELFENAAGIELLSVAEWMGLLAIQNPFAMPIILRVFEKSVRPDRLDDPALIRLAGTTNGPAATLALSWLKDRRVDSGDALKARLVLALAPADTVRKAAAEWLCEILHTQTFGTPEHVRELLDANHQDVRTQALALLQRNSSFGRDVGLWVSMSETPYDDVRAHLLARLEAENQDLNANAMHRVWAAVLLAVHRGSRAKARAARQIATRLIKEPTRAEELLPLLAVSLKSLRRPEKTSAIAAVAKALFHHPGLQGLVKDHLPGLSVKSGPS